MHIFYLKPHYEQLKNKSQFMKSINTYDRVIFLSMEQLFFLTGLCCYEECQEVQKSN